jgi:hypothetical protein
LKELERQLMTSERDLKALEATSAEFRSRVALLITEALDLGLLAAMPGDEVSTEGQLEILTRLSLLQRPEPRVTSAGVAEVDRDFLKLKMSESATASEVLALRRRRHEIASLRDSAGKFRGGVAIQKERLEVSRWLSSQLDENTKCPLCGGNQEPADADLRVFVQQLQTLEDGAATFEIVPDTLDRELLRVDQELGAKLEELAAIQIQIRNIESRSKAAEKDRFTERNAARFLGRVETNLSLMKRMAPDGELRAKVNELRQQIAELRRALQDSNVAAKGRAALEAINNYAGRYIANLDAEDPNLPIRFQRNDLSLKVVRGSREDYLWELGSGSNWLSYHIAITLAFHRYFLSLVHCPVPTFVVMDQPSQVYFPKTLANRPNRDNPDPEFTDVDVLAVRKIFSTLSSVINEVPGRLQVIVLDHAAEEVWTGIPSVHLVEEWREGTKLVPESWPSV